MPDQINKVLVEGTTYEITPSNTGTFDGTSEDDASPSSWTTVSALTSGETNGSIFTKISQMFKNIRFLYGKLGTVDISTTGSSVTDAIANLETNKADVGHTHSVATTAAAGFAPILSGTATEYLNGAGEFSTPPDTNTTYATFTSAANGLVPAAISGTTNYATTGYVLTGAGWAAGTKYNTDTNTTYAVFTGSTTAAAGTNGLVPAPTTAQVGNYFLKHNKTWAVPPNTTYANLKGATTAAAGTAGLVPAPASGAATRYLRSDATWQVPPNTNTTYAFSNNAPTLAWNTTSTVGTVGGVALTVKMPANPNTNTTYGTNVGCYGTLSGTTLTLNTRNFRV